jgi:hypothetical protein
VCAVSLTLADIGVVPVAAGAVEGVEEEGEEEEGTPALLEIPKLREHTPSSLLEWECDPCKVHRHPGWKRKTAKEVWKWVVGLLVMEIVWCCFLVLVLVSVPANLHCCRLTSASYVLKPRKATP